MDKNQLRQKAAEMKKSLFDQGVLNSYFRNLEYIEAGQPHFVEEMIVTYFAQSALYLDELREALEKYPLDMRTIERVIMKLKGGSATMGAARFNAIVNEMCNVFKRGETDRLYDEFQRVTAEHGLLKMQLEPYAELLHMLRDDVPPPVQDEVSVSHEDAESSASNDMEE